MQAPYSLDSICADLSQAGYVVVDDFMPPNLVKSLAQTALARHENGDFLKAGTGLQANQHGLRGDYIHWLEESDTDTEVQQYLASMEALRQALNQQMLNVQNFETHFAVYAPGAIYHKHLDQFAGGADNARQVSCIVYLNQDWQRTDGGQLRLYLNQETLDILPQGGRLVLFLSGEFWHEVLPANRTRISLTGWFRRRASTPY